MSPAALARHPDDGPVDAAAGSPADLRPEASDLGQLWSVYEDAGTSENTRRSYRSRLALFVAWCTARGLCAVPAHPEVLRQYLVALSNEKRSLSTINLSHAAIVKAHRVRGHEPPTSAPLRAALREMKQTLDPPDGVPFATFQAIVAACAHDALATRDRALLLVTYFAGLRRAQTAGLDREGVRREADGYLVWVSNREGTPVRLPMQSNLDLCPVRALDDWLTERATLARGVDLSAGGGPLFLALHRGGCRRPLRVGERISPEDVGRVLKRRARAAGIDAATVSARDLRVGASTESARRGAPSQALRARARRHGMRPTLRGAAR